WLGPCAYGVLHKIESLRTGISRKLLADLDRAVKAIRSGEQAKVPATEDTCCSLPSGLESARSWTIGSRSGCEPIETTVFEDHTGGLITYKEFFKGRPSIVVFFYTRCDNPLKCSLTVTKLANVQKLLEARGVAHQINTAAITYDPAFDFPDRLRGYGQNRGVRLDTRHRMLRTIRGFEGLR